jgi:hypothetical protein
MFAGLRATSSKAPSNQHQTTPSAPTVAGLASRCYCHDNPPVYSSPLLVPGVPNTTMGGMPGGALKPGMPAGPAPPSEKPSSCCLLVLLPPTLLRSLLLCASGLSSGAGGASTVTGADAAPPPLACTPGVTGTSGVCDGPAAPLPLAIPAAATWAGRELAAAAVLPTAATGARTTRCMLCVEPSAAGPVWCMGLGVWGGNRAQVSV